MSSIFDLSGKAAVVTGASSGLGMSAAKACAEAGAEVALLDLLGEELESVKIEIEKTGRRAITVECDVTNEVSVKIAVQKVLDTYGKIDVLLNSAGIALSGGINSLTKSEWGRTFGYNVRGTFFVNKYVIPMMKESGGGKIVNIALANLAIPESNCSSVSPDSPKVSAIDLTKNVAKLYAQYGITVETIEPSLFEIQMKCKAG